MGENSNAFNKSKLIEEAQKHLQDARSLCHNKQWDKATRAYKAAIQKNPDYLKDKDIKEGIIGCYIANKDRDSLREFLNESPQRLDRAEAWIDFQECDYKSAARRLCKYVPHKGPLALSPMDLAIYIASENNGQQAREITKFFGMKKDELFRLAEWTYAEFRAKRPASSSGMHVSSAYGGGSSRIVRMIPSS